MKRPLSGWLDVVYIDVNDIRDDLVKHLLDRANMASDMSSDCLDESGVTTQSELTWSRPVCVPQHWTARKGDRDSVIHGDSPEACLTGGASAASEEPKAMSESAARAC